MMFVHEGSRQNSFSIVKLSVFHGFCLHLVLSLVKKNS